MNVSLCRDDDCYEAGGMFRAKWRVRRVPIEDLQAVEISVLWRTEGKGDEDLHVHHFRRIGGDELRRVGLADEQSVACQLPLTPLTYHGRLVKIRWCLRMRLFMNDGREIVTQQPFYLVSSESVGSDGQSRQRPKMLLRSSEFCSVDP